MIILGLDTSGSWCTAALVNNSQVLGDRSENIGRGHAEALAPMVQQLLIDAAVQPSDIDRISICTGPGSFTGLRVALAFGRAFALPYKTQVIGLSALEVLAAQSDPDQTLKVAAVMNVKRGQLCSALYHGGQEILPPLTLTIDETKDRFARKKIDIFTGDGAELMWKTSSAEKFVKGPVLAWMAQAKSLTEFPPTPLYSRPPDAKLPGGVTYVPPAQ